MLWLCTRQWPWNIEHHIIIHTLQPLKESFPTTKNWRSVNLCFDFQPVIDNSVHRHCHWVSRKYLGVKFNSTYFLFPNSSVFFLINLHKVIISLMATLGFWHKYTKTKKNTRTIQIFTSCGGTSKETVRRSTFLKMN